MIYIYVLYIFVGIYSYEGIPQCGLKDSSVIHKCLLRMLYVNVLCIHVTVHIHICIHVGIHMGKYIYIYICLYLYIKGVNYDI